MQYFGFDRPSFGIKTFGFGESSPKLQADFTTGTYKASGAAKTFADLFTFNRAGKAWLVKETGLQEYAADVPRLDDGLLIEQSATNYVKNSLLLESYSTELTTSGGVWITGGGYLTGIGTMIIGSKFDLGSTPKNIVGSVYVTSPTKPSGWISSDKADFYINLSGAVQALDAIKLLGDLWKVASESKSLSGNPSLGVARPQPPSPFYRYAEVSYKYLQFEETRSTSMIPTTTAPVTRPADFLLNKITGTTVTGDWDSTLTLSIVAGQLVHSGYGRIRSLEIN